MLGHVERIGCKVVGPGPAFTLWHLYQGRSFLRRTFFFKRGGHPATQVFEVGDVLIHNLRASCGQGTMPGDEPQGGEFFEPRELPPPVFEIRLTGSGVGAVGDEIA